MEENISQVVLPKKRPTFITVLCILSLIGSGGFGLLQSIYQYVTFEDSYAEQITKMEESLEQMEEAGMDSGFFYDMAANGRLALEKQLRI